MLAAAVLLAACGKEQGAMEFNVYEQEAQVDIPTETGEWQLNISLCVDIPDGDGAAQASAAQGIMEVIASSNVAKMLGTPKGNTLKEVCDNYVSALKNDVAKDFDRLRSTEAFCSNLHLAIRCTYQNEACVVMFVENGANGEYGTSRQYEAVIRLADGHVLTREEIADISKEKLIELALEYADEAQDAEMDVKGEYGVSIGHGALLFSPDQYFWDEYAIPMEAADEYLTDEAKALLTAEEFKAGVTPEPAKGDLALYDLRGPVRQLQKITKHSTTTYTFDPEGALTSETHEMGGSVLDSEPFYDRTVRDDQGRGVERYRDSDVKELNVFDESGRLIKQEYWVGRRLEWRNVNYYDINGRLYKTNTKGTVSGDQYYTGTTKYFCDRGFAYDKHGNWTEYTCQKPLVDEKRVITYYGDGEDAE